MDYGTYSLTLYCYVKRHTHTHICYYILIIKLIHVCEFNYVLLNLDAAASMYVFLYQYVCTCIFKWLLI